MHIHVIYVCNYVLIVLCEWACTKFWYHFELRRILWILCNESFSTHKQFIKILKKFTEVVYHIQRGKYKVMGYNMWGHGLCLQTWSHTKMVCKILTFTCVIVNQVISINTMTLVRSLCIVTELVTWWGRQTFINV